MAATTGRNGTKNGKVRQLKVVLLGDTAVGKSSIALRAVGRDFNQKQETTIGASFFSHMIPVEDGVVKMSLWDTAGQEKYRALAPMYYRGTQAALVVYDITSDVSFTSAKRWLRELRQTTLASGPDTFIALVGNKADMEGSRVVQYEDARQFADNEGLFFLETSAKTGQNVDELFNHVAKNAKSDPPMQKQATIRVGRKRVRGKRNCCSS